MVISNKDIMANARLQLQGKWGSVVSVSIIYLVLMVVLGSMRNFGGIVSFVIGGPIAFGLNNYFLSFTRGEKPQLEDFFKGFSIFAKTFVAYLLIIIFIVLWALLLIIPGIIAAISYSMTYYIMVDNPELDAQNAIKKSKQIMNGNKYRYFCFLCRFIGWFLLSIITFGIGFVWLIPYFLVSNSKFYETLIQSGVRGIELGEK